MTELWNGNKTMAAKLLASACFAGSCLIPAVCNAQANLSPPRQAASSPTGVNYRTGAMSYSEADLSLAGGLPIGLALSRSYNSSVKHAGPGANWVYSVEGYVSAAVLPEQPGSPWPAGQEPYIYNVTFGDKTVGFVGGSHYLIGVSTTGGPVGTYTPSIPSGATLVYNGTSPTSGYYTFTDGDGTVVNFTAAGLNGKISNWTMPDGTRLDYTYSGINLQSIISNRGWALLFNGTTVCAVSLAQSYVTASSSCPSGAQAVTYALGASSYSAATNLLLSATRATGTTNYQYNSKDHLNCVKAPGQSYCKLQTTYGICADDPQIAGSQGDLHLADYVTSQQDAAGKTYAYTYTNGNPDYPAQCPKWTGDPNDDYRSSSYSYATLTEAGIATTTYSLDLGGNAFGISDPLGRTTAISLQTFTGPAGGRLPDTEVTQVAAPEANSESYSRDTRGNVTSKTLTPKPGSSLASIVTSATYPSSCSNVKICNKPSTVTDANGNVTSFTYDATHGGVLTETGPADPAGVQPVKRYAYVQRYAWIKNSSGGFSQAATPVWLLDEMRMCRTSATVSGACAAGSSDEVLTKYEYGPNTGSVGNNLLLRGTAVTANSVTLRSCVGYDRDGNKIFETKPAAGLTACS